MPAKDVAREAAFAAITAARDDITALAREIFEHPEPGWEAQRAAGLLAELFERSGFEVERGFRGQPAALRATKKNWDTEAMRKGLRHAHVAFLAAYDADPYLGHAHGRHLTAAAAAAAAIGLAAALETERGAVTVIGWPAAGEPGSLREPAEAGIFEEFDALLSARPVASPDGFCDTIEGTGDTLATGRARVIFNGDRTADALTSYRGLLDERIETLADGERIEIDERAAGALGIDLVALTAPRLHELCERLHGLARSAAAGAGTTGDIRIETFAADAIVNRIIARRVKTYGNSLGLKMDRIHKQPAGPAVSWGGASYQTPTYVARFPLPDAQARPGEAAFAAAASTPEAYEQMFRMAEAQCFTGLDLLRDMQMRSIADGQLIKTLKARGMQRAHRRWLGVHPVKPAPEGEKVKGPKMTEFKWVHGPGLRDN